jgi:hypothetical protein
LPDAELGNVEPSWPPGRSGDDDIQKACPAGRNGGNRNGGKEAIVLKTALLVGVGVVLILAGIIFTLQGAGVIGGSGMSGVTLWAVIGPVIALAGLVMVAVGSRRRVAS